MALFFPIRRAGKIVCNESDVSGHKITSRKWILLIWHCTQLSYYFCAYHGFGNPFSCITVVKRVANKVENSSGKAKRCHSGRLGVWWNCAAASSTISRMRYCEEFIPVTGMKCLYGKNFQPAYRPRPLSHMNTSKILQRI